MSDLEASLRRIGNAAAPVSTAAVGKLRAISGTTGRLFGNADGLVDVFAEVFANIAQSQSPVRPEAKPREEKPLPAQREARESRPESVSPQRQVEPTRNNSEQDRQSAAVESLTTTRPNEESSHDPAHEDEEALPAFTADNGPQPTPAELAAPKVKESANANPAAKADVEVATPLPNDSDATNDQQRDPRSRGDAVQPTRQPTVESSADSGANGETAKPASEAASGNLGDEAKQQPGDSSSSRWADMLSEDDRNARAEHLQDRKTGLANQRDRDASQKSVASPSAQVSDQTLQAKTSVNALLPAKTAVQGASALPSADVAQAAAASSSASSNSTTPASSTTLNGNVRTRSLNQAVDTVHRAETRSEAKPKETPQSTSETVSRAKLIQRVSKAFQHLGNEGGIIRMRLAPAELGSVRVEMRVQHRKVEARVVAETEAASAALRQYLPDLRQRLEAQGMQIERIEIESETSEDTSQGQFGGYDRGDRSGRQPQRRPSPWSAERSDDSAVSQSVSRVDVGLSSTSYVPVTGGVDARF